MALQFLESLKIAAGKTVDLILRRTKKMCVMDASLFREVLLHRAIVGIYPHGTWPKVILLATSRLASLRGIGL